MFTFEVRINGSLIAHIYGHNTGHNSEDGTDSYDYSYYDVEKRTMQKGSVCHHRSHGILPLVSRIIDGVSKKKKS